MLTGWPASGTAAMPVPLLTGACAGVADVAGVLTRGTCAIRGDPTRCGPRAASWAGRAGDAADPAGADPRGAEAGVAAGPEAAHAVSANAGASVKASAVAILVSRTVIDNSHIRRDQGRFRESVSPAWPGR
jgi:hypothetical protein